MLIVLVYAGMTQMPALITKLKHAQDPSTLSLVQSSQPANSVHYFVDPAGDDSSDGTSPESAFETIQKAINKALPGDTIYLGNGQYLQDFKTVRDGREGQPIIITGFPDAVVLGSGGSRIAEINHSFIQLIGFTIDGLVGDGQTEQSYRDKLLYIHGIERDGLHDIKILKMTLQNAGGECMRLRYFVNDSEIAYNIIDTCGVHDFRFNNGGKNGEAIYIGTAPEQLKDGKNPTTDPDESNKNWIHHNTIRTQGNECVDIKESSRFNVVEYNTCTGQKDPESAGLDARGSNNIFRYNNVSNSIGAGIRLGGDEDTDGINNNVYGNTLRGNKYGGIKIERVPQGKVCDNKITGTPSSRFVVGSESEDIDPTQPCR